MKPDGWQYTLTHGKVLDKAIAAGIEPLEFRRKVENNMQLDLVTHDPAALFNSIAKQQRDQALIEANDAERRQTTNGVTLGRWLLRGPSRREVLRTSTTHARVPWLLV